MAGSCPIAFEWGEYVELFGTKPSRIDLLNRAAPAFFGAIQDTLFEDYVLHLARLTDATATFKNSTKANLTIRALPELVPDAGIRAELEKAVGEALQRTEFCRDWRNRLLAHRDLNLVMDPSSRPLVQASRKQMSDALEALAKVINVLLRHYLNSETRFDLGSRIDGAKALLYVIRDGVRTQQERNQKILQGEWNIADYDPEV